MSTIIHRLYISASAQQIFIALSTKQGLACWWTPNVESKGSSTWRFTFGENYYKEMQVAELVPNKTVKWNCTHGSDEWIGTFIEFNLEKGTKKDLLNSNPELHDQLNQDNGNHGTVVELIHSGWKEASPQFAECNYTWALFMKSLKSYCEIGKGNPWPRQHTVMK